ncbi:site-specific DNA-methyltransferase [Treponema primitia]|uniref:site-specific DNA-methyltransferase n=1 Tax=Treponema primitia TaxID=88058 RepID=UPI00397F69E5
MNTERIQDNSSTKQASGGLRAAMSNNATVKPNSDLLNTLKNTLPQFFEKDIVDEEGNLIESGAFKSDKFLDEIKANNIAEAHDGYKLGFVGKDYARLLSGRVSETVIVPDHKHNSLPENKDSGNVFITGDNIDALRHLVNAYENRIKLIYIDPPYNTGKEFVYSDKFEFEDEKLVSALGYTEAEIVRLKSIQGKSSHSAWLTFMYPRLKIAQKLLTPDGVIFISIDDNEQANLKLLMDDVFGEGNFVSSFIVTRAEGGGLAKQAVIGHDYALVYCKNISQFIPLGKVKDIRGKIVNIDGDDYWIETDWLRKEFGKYGTCLYEEILEYFGKQKKDEIDEGLKQGNYILIDKGGAHIVGRYRKVSEDTSKFYTILKHLNKDGNADLENLGLLGLFDNPKPISLCKELILGGTIRSINDNDLILDFFAGSATTAHAVMQLNADDGGNRKYIMVQWDEPTNEDSEARKANPPFNTIDEISRERIKRAGTKILEKYNEKETANAEELALEDEPEQPKWDKDIGFKHYRLVTLNVKTLDKIEIFDPSAPLLIAEDMISPFARPETETSGLETLLTTWLIDDGFTFDTPVENLGIAGYSAHLVQSKLYLIAPDWGAKQTKDLLNRIGKNELNVQHIVVYAYSFLMESLRELEINIKNTLDADHQVYVERRY